MIRITAQCPRCERVELGTDDITLVVNPWQDTAWYLFDCLGCAHSVVKPAPRSVISALTSVHVPVSIVPAEALEQIRLDQNRPMDIDDLLDALLWLRACCGPGGPSTDVTPIDADSNHQAEPAELTHPGSNQVENGPAYPNAA